MKRMFYKSTACFAVTLACGVASAQTAPATEPAAPAPAAAPAAAPAPAPAPEQAAPVAEFGAGEGNPEEVVVTARRIQERAQDVPISMTIFNQQQLTNRNIVNGGDLATYTPSLTSNTEFGSDNTSFAIRGFSQQIGTAPSVAVYFADVVAPRGGSASINTGDGGGPGSFFDLQNVQVLKGPQGTLFGRNTDGGAILLVPQRPTSELGGYLESGFGSDNMWRVQGVLNVPLADNFRLRFGVDHESRDGYMKNISGVGPSDFNDINYTAARASAVWDITPNLENYTILTYTGSDHNGSAQHLIACNPNGGNLGLLAPCEAQLARQGGNFWSTGNDLPFAHVTADQAQAINTTSWTVSDNLTAKNIVSYGKVLVDEANDLFGTAFPAAYFGGSATDAPLATSNVITAPGHHLADESSITEEIRLQGNMFDNRLKWQGGLYGEINEPIQPQGVTSQTLISCADVYHLQCNDLIGTGISNELGYPPGTVSVGSVNYQVGKLRYNDKGIYEQADFDITDKLKVTEGLRYTMDQAEAHYVEGAYAFPTQNTTPVDPNTQGNQAATPRFSCNDPRETAPTGGVTGSSCFFSAKQKSEAPTWTIGLDYKLLQDIMLYGKYSRGYRAGGINPTAPAGLGTWKPEKVESFELGEKASFDSFVRGTFNLDFFYNNFRDQQLSEGFFCDSSCDPQLQPNQAIVNAGRSRIWGFEVESIISPFKGMTLNTSYAYTNSQLETAINASDPINPGYHGSTTTDVGGDLPLAPKTKITSTATYVLPLDQKLGRISGSLGYTYTSGSIVASYGSAAAPNPYYKTKQYGLTNLNLDWNAIAGSRFDAGFFVTNLFEQRYALYRPGLYQGFGFESEIVGEPRMIGGRVRMTFGN